MANRRHIGISLAVGLSIMLVAGIVFGESNKAVAQMIGMVGFFAVFVVFHFLDERARRRARKHSQ
jgi:fatty acid desaturase